MDIKKLFSLDFELLFVVILACAIIIYVLNLAGCADSGSRNDVQNTLIKFKINNQFDVFIPASYNEHERELLLESINYQEAFLQNTFPNPGLPNKYFQIQIWDVMPNRKVIGDPLRQNHWANQISTWNIDDIRFQKNVNRVHLYRGNKFEVPGFSESRIHYFFLAPEGPEHPGDMDHIDYRWPGFRALAIQAVDGVLSNR